MRPSSKYRAPLVVILIFTLLTFVVGCRNPSKQIKGWSEWVSAPALKLESRVWSCSAAAPALAKTAGGEIATRAAAVFPLCGSQVLVAEHWDNALVLLDVATGSKKPLLRFETKAGWWPTWWQMVEENGRFLMATRGVGDKLYELDFGSGRYRHLDTQDMGRIVAGNKHEAFGLGANFFRIDLDTGVKHVLARPSPNSPLPTGTLSVDLGKSQLWFADQFHKSGTLSRFQVSTDRQKLRLLEEVNLTSTGIIREMGITPDGQKLLLAGLELQWPVTKGGKQAPASKRTNDVLVVDLVENTSSRWPTPNWPVQFTFNRLGNTVMGTKSHATLMETQTGRELARLPSSPACDDAREVAGATSLDNTILFGIHSCNGGPESRLVWRALDAPHPPKR